MKIIHVNTFDTGGAFKAAYRYHLALLNMGITSKMLVLYKSNEQLIEVYSYLEKFKFINRLKLSILTRAIKFVTKVLLLNKPKTLFSFHFSPYRIEKNSFIEEADIINLHWVAGFINYSTFFKIIKKPIFWTLHDLNPLKGGFHYDTYLIQYQARYGKLEKWVEKRKVKKLKDNNVIIIGPSHWILNKSLSSQSFKKNKHFHCHYIVDHNLFYPRDRFQCRIKLGLPLNQTLILFVAEQVNDIRKGFSIIKEILSNNEIENSSIVIVGSGSFTSLRNKIYNFGVIKDEELISDIYNACDYLINPSIEDNYPNTILESQACGTPVLAFEQTGILEMVISNETGMFFNPKNILDSIIEMNKLCKTFNRQHIHQKCLATHHKDVVLNNLIKIYEIYNN